MNTVTIDLKEYDRLRNLEKLFHDEHNYIMCYNEEYAPYRYKYYSKNTDQMISYLKDKNKKYDDTNKDLKIALRKSEDLKKEELKNMSIWEFIKIKFKKG